MIRKFGAKQLKQVTQAGFHILVSYETPVAVFDGTTLYRTERRYSVTTSKHIIFYIGELIKAGERFKIVTVPQRVIDDIWYDSVVDTAVLVTQ